MTNEEIKRKFGEVQGILDSLQGSDATCMFIGHEGNHFVISGSPTNISAQIVFAMMRYPIVRDIIKTCAERFDAVNEDGTIRRKLVHDMQEHTISKAPCLQQPENIRTLAENIIKFNFRFVEDFDQSEWE